MCEDGYYGDPLGQSGAARPCVRCDCNGNVDFNALGICDHITGRCLKCLGHTEGDHCQRCQRGFYGDALNQTAGQKCKRESLKRDCDQLIYLILQWGGRSRCNFKNFKHFNWAIVEKNISETSYYSEQSIYFLLTNRWIGGDLYKSLSPHSRHAWHAISIAVRIQIVLFITGER